jgi:hypothetical protein
MDGKLAESPSMKQAAGTEPEITNLFELICQRAYEIYEQRGRTHGNDIDDWLQAEAEVGISLASLAAEKKSKRD